MIPTILCVVTGFAMILVLAIRLDRLQQRVEIAARELEALQRFAYGTARDFEAEKIRSDDQFDRLERLARGVRRRLRKAHPEAFSKAKEEA